MTIYFLIDGIIVVYNNNGFMLSSNIDELCCKRDDFVQYDVRKLRHHS